MSAEDAPTAVSERGRALELVARLLRQVVEAMMQGSTPRFDARGLVEAAPPDHSDPEGYRVEASGREVPGEGDLDPAGALRFEVPAAVADGVSDGSTNVPGAVPAEERIAGLVREIVELLPQAGMSRLEDIRDRHPELPDAALRRIAAELARREGDTRRIPAPETGPRPATAESQLAATRSADPSLPRSRRGPLPIPEVGETIGDYRLLVVLGRGVRGAVFLADQPSLAHRPVVLKVTPRDGREHLWLAQLRHPHIVPLYCVQDLAERNLRLLCMPYLGGTPLARLLSQLDRIPIARRTGRDLLEALDRAQPDARLFVSDQGPARQFLGRASYLQAVSWIGACLADALHYAHRRDLVHLDLKPPNILLAADGTPMLLDFHLAQPPIRPNDGARRWLGGTPHYMSPEQREAMAEIHDGRSTTVAVDGRSDIYALGVVLYQMLGGAVSIGPYPMDRIKFRRPAHVPPGLADIVAKCLAFDPCDRYPDAGQLADDLRRHLADLPLRGVRNRSLTERWRKWRRRHPHSVVHGGRVAVTTTALFVAGWLIASGDARHRLRGAESLLAEGRKRIDWRDYSAAVLALNQGLSLLDDSWSLALEGRTSRSQDLQRDLTGELALARRNQLAKELHELADRLRFLYGTDLTPTDGLRALEGRLRKIWKSRRRILPRPEEGLDEELVRRLRTDLLDLGILWADLRVRLAAGSEPDARRDALRTLDEAERLFGASPVLASERQAHAEALGLIELARESGRRRTELAPRTAWEHYALGRSLLAAGDLEAAAREFDRATDLRPQDLWAQFSRGLCAYRRRRFETALRAFEVCVALSPATAQCYYNRGLAHAALGHAELARRDHNHALRLAPGMAAVSPDRSAVDDQPPP